MNFLCASSFFFFFFFFKSCSMIFYLTCKNGSNFHCLLLFTGVSHSHPPHTEEESRVPLPCNFFGVFPPVVEESSMCKFFISQAVVMHKPLLPQWLCMKVCCMGCSFSLKPSAHIFSIYRTFTHSIACNLQGHMSNEHTRWAIFISHVH